MSGIGMPWDEPQWEKMSNFYEDYFEIIPDVELDWASYVLILGLRLLNSKWCFLWNAALMKYRELTEGGGGRQLMSRENNNYMSQLTEIFLLRIPSMWKAFRALHNNFYLCNLWLNKGFAHIDNFIWFAQPWQVGIMVPILKVRKWRLNDISKML